MSLKRSLRWLKNVCNVVCLFFPVVSFLYNLHCSSLHFIVSLSTVSRRTAKICEGQRLFLYQTKQQRKKKVMTLYLPWINKFYNVLGVSSHVVCRLSEAMLLLLLSLLLLLLLALPHLVTHMCRYKYKNENVK